MEKLSTSKAFTLLEMAIVIAIIGVLLGGGAVIFASSLKQRQAKDTEARLEAIQKALLDYRTAFHRLPCPGDLALALDDAEFGLEAADPGDCTTGSPAVTFSDGDTVAGMVPTRTLAMADDYAFDGWGRRIMYTVDRRMTANLAFDGVPVTDVTTRLTVLDASGAVKTDRAVYVLYSSGHNGHGSYPRNGGTTRLPAGSVNVSELENCDCDAAAAATAFDGDYVQKPPTENPANLADRFDDMVVFAVRSAIRSASE